MKGLLLNHRVYFYKSLTAPCSAHLSMFHIVLPLSLIAGTIGIVEGPIAFPLAPNELAIIHVPQRVLGAAGAAQEPDMLPHTMLKSE